LVYIALVLNGTYISPTPNYHFAHTRNWTSFKFYCWSLHYWSLFRNK